MLQVGETKVTRCISKLLQVQEPRHLSNTPGLVFIPQNVLMLEETKSVKVWTQANSPDVMFFSSSATLESRPAQVSSELTFMQVTRSHWLELLASMKQELDRSC